MGILSRYDEIMEKDYTLSVEDLAGITDGVGFYLELGQQIRQQQEDYEQTHRETSLVLEHEFECKKVLDLATESATKYKAMIRERDTDALREKYTESVALQDSARRDYDSALSDTSKMHNLLDKIAANIFELKIQRKYIRERTFGGNVY